MRLPFQGTVGAEIRPTATACKQACGACGAPGRHSANVRPDASALARSCHVKSVMQRSVGCSGPIGLNKPEGALGRCQRLCIARPCTTLHHTETRQHALQHTQFSTAHTSTHKRSSRRALANHTSQRARARQRALQHTQCSTAHASMHKRTVARAEELSKITRAKELMRGSAHCSTRSVVPLTYQCTSAQSLEPKSSQKNHTSQRAHASHYVVATRITASTC